MIVHYTDTAPAFAYAATIEAATRLVNTWLLTKRSESVGTITVLYTPCNEVVYHKRLNQPGFFAGLLGVV